MSSDIEGDWQIKWAFQIDYDKCYVIFILLVIVFIFQLFSFPFSGSPYSFLLFIVWAASVACGRLPFWPPKITYFHFPQSLSLPYSQFHYLKQISDISSTQGKGLCIFSFRNNLRGWTAQRFLACLCRVRTACVWITSAFTPYVS